MSPYLGMSLLDIIEETRQAILFQSPYLGMSLLDWNRLFHPNPFKFQSPYLGMSLMDRNLRGGPVTYCFSPHTWGCPLWTLEITHWLLAEYGFSPHTWGCPLWTNSHIRAVADMIVSVPILGDVPYGLF